MSIPCSVWVTRCRPGYLLPVELHVLNTVRSCSLKYHELTQMTGILKESYFNPVRPTGGTPCRARSPNPKVPQGCAGKQSEALHHLLPEQNLEK